VPIDAKKERGEKRRKIRESITCKHVKARVVKEKGKINNVK